ncbi:MAG: DUF1990 domain-containing protein [Planctomycetaceae bacterium]|nr:DUF1990 domain-containing protein [Planctomycetaceae bacterium]
MLSLRKPDAERLQLFLAEQAKLDFTYKPVVATATTPPSGFVVDHTRVKLGEGESVYLVAMAAMKRWKQFQLGWVDTFPPELPIEPGNVVAVMGSAAGFWWTNACRIVHVIDESGPVERFGFAYGTLPGHVECGEERFLVEWDHKSNGVWYDILAFSKPNHPLSRLGYPFVRRLQKQFGRDSASAMIQAIDRR